MQRKRKVDVVSVWIIVIFTVIAITLVAMFMMVYQSILQSEERTNLREQVNVLRDNADASVVDVIQNQASRRLATKDASTGYIGRMATGEQPDIATVLELTSYFRQVKATVDGCERVEIYFPATNIIVGSQGVQYLNDRKYTIKNSVLDYIRDLYPSEDKWVKRTVMEEGENTNYLTYVRSYPGVFAAGHEPMIALTFVESEFMDLVRSSLRTLTSNDILLLVDQDGKIWNAESGYEALIGTVVPAADTHSDPVQLSNGLNGLLMEAASASGMWYYAILRPSNLRASGYRSLISVWAILCVAMLFAGLAMVLQIMMKHYARPIQRLVKSLTGNEGAENGRALTSPSVHFMQLETALSDMNKLKQEREYFMTHNQPLLRQSWLNCFVQGEAYYSAPHPQLGIEFPYPHFQVVITSAQPSEQELACIHAPFADQPCMIQQFESREKECVLLFNHSFSEGELPKLLEKAGESLDDMQSALVLGVGVFAPNDELVPASFRCARRAFSYRYFEKNRRVCVFDPTIRYSEPENLLNEVIHQLTEVTGLIQKESKEKVDQAIDSIVAQLKETSPYLNTMRSIMLITAMRLTKVVYDVKGAPEEVYGDNLMNAYYHIGGISEFSQRLKHDCELLRQYLSKENSPENRSVVQYAIHHIRNSAPAELSIHSIAEAIGISTGHLSRMFHQETGRKLVDYLQEVRMEHASRLIAEGELTNEEICGIIGYSRLQYFSAKFKEHYGLTINEYRRQLQSE